MPNLPYAGRKGWWKLTKLNRASLLAYEEVRSATTMLLFYAHAAAAGARSLNSRLSRNSAKITLMSLMATAQSISFLLGF